MRPSNEKGKRGEWRKGRRRLSDETGREEEEEGEEETKQLARNRRRC